MSFKFSFLLAIFLFLLVLSSLALGFSKALLQSEPLPLIACSITSFPITGFASGGKTIISFEITVENARIVQYGLEVANKECRKDKPETCLPLLCYHIESFEPAVEGLLEGNFECSWTNVEPRVYNVAMTAYHDKGLIKDQEGAFCFEDSAIVLRGELVDLELLELTASVNKQGMLEMQAVLKNIGVQDIGLSGGVTVDYIRNEQTGVNLTLDPASLTTILEAQTLASGDKLTVLLKAINFSGIPKGSYTVKASASEQSVGSETETRLSNNSKTVVFTKKSETESIVPELPIMLVPLVVLTVLVIWFFKSGKAKAKD